MRELGEGEWKERNEYGEGRVRAARARVGLVEGEERVRLGKGRV
jgi:hypothetical protein